MDPDFLDAVKSLTIAVLDFLGASDGLDDHRIANMNASVFSVLDEASKNPALKLWAEDQRASHEAAMSAFYDKIK